MGKIPNELRETIARNIRACRIKKYPGRGGGKKCAEDFGVSPQQWSPWERAMRTPDELRLSQIADFFGVTVEYLRRDNTKPSEPALDSPDAPEMRHDSAPNPEQAHPYQLYNPLVGLSSGMPPMDMPGSPASFYWLARHFVHYLITEGIKVRVEDKEAARTSRNEDDQK